MGCVQHTPFILLCCFTSDDSHWFLIMNFYAITNSSLPPALHGSEAGYAVRTLTEDERITIEDFFFAKDERISVPTGSTAVIIDSLKASQMSLSDFATFVEFGLSLLTVSGFQSVSLVAALGVTGCHDAIQLSCSAFVDSPKFAPDIVPETSNIWFRSLFRARKNAKDQLHITADRFVRYCRVQHTPDALLDLCISLESLLDTNTEISFRFSTCLAKITKRRDAEELSDLLVALYDLRSKIVHGSDATKVHLKIRPSAGKLRLAARTILTSYVFFLNDRSKKDWQIHLRRSLFS